MKIKIIILTIFVFLSPFIFGVEQTYATTIGPISVAADADDAEIYHNGSGWFFSSSGNSSDGLGWSGDGFTDTYSQIVFFRFVLPSAIPFGATINSATIDLRGRSSFSWDATDDLQITATDSASAGAPTTAGERMVAAGGSTAVTTAVASWNNITWSTAGYNTSASIASVIQELVNDNNGLASGAGIVIWVNETNQISSYVAAELNEYAGSAEVAKLTINYEVTDQEGFRFRNDDGSETTATWLADQDTNITRDKDLTTRLRFLVDSTGDLSASQYQLEWRKMGDSASDDFDRPNNVSLSSNWTEAYSDQGILSNKLALTTSEYVKNLAIFSGSATASTDQYVKAAVYSTVAGGYPEMVFRYTNSLSSYYAIEFNVDGDTALWRRYATASGVPDNISASTAMTITSGDVFGITVSGTGTNTVVRVWRNPTGNSPNSATDWGGDSSPDLTFIDDPATPVNSGTYAGVGGYMDYGAANGSISFDNFFTGDVSGGANLNAPWRIATTTIGSDITIVGSSNIGASGANTTAQFAPPSGKMTSDFIAGRIQDDENPADSVDITIDDYTEFEWSIVATSTTVTGNVFQFRVTSNGLPFNLSRTPQWTIGTVPTANPGSIISRFLIRWGAIKVNNGRVIIK